MFYLNHILLPSLNTWLVLFLIFSFGLLLALVMAVKSSTPLGSILFFLLAMVNQGGLFLLMNFEFFALILLLVYAGAIMMLYLFVVMMLQLPTGRFQWQSLSSVKYIVILFVTEIVCVYQRSFFSFQERFYFHSFYNSTVNPVDIITMRSMDSRSLGYLLFTFFSPVVVLQGFILLLVLVASVFLVSHDEEFERGA